MVFKIVEVFYDLYDCDWCVACHQFIHRQICWTDEIVALLWECWFLWFIVLHNEAGTIFEEKIIVLVGDYSHVDQCLLHRFLSYILNTKKPAG